MLEAKKRHWQRPQDRAHYQKGPHGLCEAESEDFRLRGAKLAVPCDEGVGWAIGSSASLTTATGDWCA